MVNNFKYLELMRHHMYSKAKKIVSDLKDKDDEDFNHISEVIFSSAMSLFVTYLAERLFIEPQQESTHLNTTIIWFAIAIVIYCFLFYIIKKVYSFIKTHINHFIYNKKIHSFGRSALECKELVDDFDHIVCDNLLLSYELINTIKKDTETNNIYLRTFYFHETIYYIRSSIDITKRIIHPDKRENCLNIFGKTNGIDVSRLKNACEMMNHINKELSSILDNNISNNEHIIEVFDDKLKSSVQFKLKLIKQDVDRINDACNSAIADVNRDK